MPKPSRVSRSSTLMSQQAYADRIGKSKQYVNKLVRQGKIRKVGNQIDAKQADAAIKAYSRPGRILRPAPRKSSPAKSHKASPRRSTTRHARAIAAHHADEVPVASLPSGHRGDATCSLTANRAVREFYEAKQAEIDYLKNVGRLLPADQVLEAERRKNENIRTIFRRMPRSIAPLLVMKQAAEIEDILRREVDSILSSLARDPLGMAASNSPMPPVVEIPADVPAIPPPAPDPAPEASL